MTFWECVQACVSQPEYVANWARLRGVHLPSSPLEQMIDSATGHDASIAKLFLADVFDLVYSRLPEATA